MMEPSDDLDKYVSEFRKVVFKNATWENYKNNFYLLSFYQLEQ